MIQGNPLDATNNAWQEQDETPDPKSEPHFEDLYFSLSHIQTGERSLPYLGARVQVKTLITNTW